MAEKAVETLKVTPQVKVTLTRKMKGRETYDDVLRRLLRLPRRPRPWDEAGPEPEATPALAKHSPS